MLSMNVIQSSFNPESLDILDSYPELKHSVNCLMCLLDSNITDYSVMKSVSEILTSNQDKKMCDKLLNYIHTILSNQREAFKEKKTLELYCKVTNFSIYLLVFLINTENNEFKKQFFHKDSKIIKELLELIKDSKKLVKKDNNKICLVLSNLFLNEYKEMQCKLDIDSYIKNYEKFSEINTVGITEFSNNTYESILNNILKLNFSYSFLLENKVCSMENKLLCKFFIYIE